MRQDSSSGQEYDPVEVRRSFIYLFMDVTFFLGGFAFLDASTVLPSFLASLKCSPLLIGAITAIRPAGVFLPQLYTAHYLRNRTKHKGYLLKGAMLSRAGVTLFAVVLLISRASDRGIMLAAFLVMYAAFWLSEGWVTVSWTDLVAKTIPERLRGRLFGLTQVVGGGLAILMGLLASRMLSSGGPRYPLNYGILFVVSAVFLWSSLLSLNQVHEPEGASEDHDVGFPEYVKRIGKALKEHGQLKRLLLVQLLMGAFSMSLPFYVLYARQASGISGGTVGLLLSAQMVGVIFWSGIAGYISDHRGPKSAIMLTIVTGVLATVLALSLGASPVWLYGILFFSIGGATGTAVIGPTNFLLELAAPEERRAYVGVLNTANAPTLIFPVLGGLIAQVASYRAVFLLTGLVLLIGFILALGLKTKEQR